MNIFDIFFCLGWIITNTQNNNNGFSGRFSFFNFSVFPDYYRNPHRRGGDGGDRPEDAQILPFWKYGQPHESYRNYWWKGKNKCLRIYLSVSQGFCLFHTSGTLLPASFTWTYVCIELSFTNSFSASYKHEEAENHFLTTPPGLYTASHILYLTTFVWQNNI